MANRTYVLQANLGVAAVDGVLECLSAGATARNWHTCADGVNPSPW